MVSFGSILLKNSSSAADEKIGALIGREARFELRGYKEELMSQRGASERSASGNWAVFLIGSTSDGNLPALRFRVFQQNRPEAAVGQYHL
jgi:hypothetical protein